jgi:formamidopyrimidine-DNA glycosylase
MPEMPDVTVYIEALGKRVLGQTLERVRLASPFLLRTAEPPLARAFGEKVLALRRMGKRICIGLGNETWLVLHLMIAGRLHWHEKGSARAAKLAGKQYLAALDFSSGTVVWTEAGSKKRASLHVVNGEAGLRKLDRGGVDVLECSLREFARILRSENHTLKRALTDPRWFSGIGNAYSDEILFAAKLSPIALTRKLSDEEVARLFEALRRTLTEWTERLRREAGDKFPEKVTAFRPEMAVHGKFRQVCVRCGGKIQRIKYAENETDYCPACQTGGRLLADRALSRLLREDWPKSLDEMEMKMSEWKNAVDPGKRP